LLDDGVKEGRGDKSRKLSKKVHSFTIVGEN